MDKWQQAASSPVNIFYSYAPEDEKLRLRLEKHLSLLRHQGLIADWHNHKIDAGSEREQVINQHLESASLILLLISPDFMASDYCYGVEMQYALKRHREGRTRVIPILLRPVDWQGAPFAPLQYLPRDGKAVTQSEDRDIAFLNIVKEIRDLIDPTDLKEEEASRRVPIILDQNRLRFLKRVRALWIVGVLEHSLFNATLMLLDLREVPEAVENPWHLLVQETNRPPRSLPPMTHIIDVYDEANGELLILGEPGAGKTTLLLELARRLLLRVETTVDHPLPAIFTLSSWAEKRQPLASWLVEELHDRYQVPRKLGASWIASAQLLPLLDGLDEVAPVHRIACIEAINHYHQEHSLAPLVICSRHAEYVAQPTRIELQRSVVVQPLSLHQIDECLSNAGEQLSGLRIALQKDAELQELATTPLMLNILMLTYQDMPLDELASIKSPELLRKQVFVQYTTRMLQRRSRETRYTPQYTIICLINLARQMKRHAQTEFYIERMQMDWLATPLLNKCYRIGTTLICGLVGMSIGLFAIWITIKPTEILPWLIGCGGFAIAAGPLNILQPEIRPSETFAWSWKIVFHRWFNILLFMVLGGLVGGLGIKPHGNVIVATLMGGVCGILFSIVLNVLLEGEPNTIPDNRRINTPNQEIRKSAQHAFLIFLVTALFILIFLQFSKLGVILTCLFGLTGILGFGGLACIQHMVLRLLLWRSGQLPWNLPRFLDYAAERIFLRKVGGGYIFVHRLLLDYFASLDEDES